MWPHAAHVQQVERVRGIGVLMGYAESDPLGQRYAATLRKDLEELGWREDRNARIDIRFAAADPDRMRTYATELVTAAPDVILANTTTVTAAVLRRTRTIPVVFVVVSDPVGSGFVQSLARPGKNATGFINIEASVVTKSVELLKEVAPQVTRAALMFNPDTAAYAGYYMRPFEAAVRSIGSEPIGAPVRDEGEIENVISSLARNAGGLVMMTDIYMTSRRATINKLALQHRVPVINLSAVITRDGGLMTYGVDIGDLFHRTAPYLDRILRGTSPADLPVQVPTKFELVINLKTAKALGLTVPPSILARADEVIE
jgi:putative ABC transport system substrate-binding protein